MLRAALLVGVSLAPCQDELIAVFEATKDCALRVEVKDAIKTKHFNGVEVRADVTVACP